MIPALTEEIITELRKTGCAFHNDAEPCWGELDFYPVWKWDRDGYIAACEGHAEWTLGKHYKPKPERVGA